MLTAKGLPAGHIARCAGSTNKMTQASSFCNNREGIKVTSIPPHRVGQPLIGQGLSVLHVLWPIGHPDTGYVRNGNLTLYEYSENCYVSGCGCSKGTTDSVAPCFLRVLSRRACSMHVAGTNGHRTYNKLPHVETKLALRGAEAYICKQSQHT